MALKKMKKGYLWVTFAFFVVSFAGHWTFSWLEYKEQQEQHEAPVEVRGYFIKVMRETLENWQSEFLQLCWQVAGLAMLWYIGSPQSKEGDERKEAKLDHLLDKVYGPKQAQEIRSKLEEKYPKK